MKLDELIELYDRDQRINWIDPRYDREVAGKVIRYAAHGPGRFSYISYANLSEAEADHAIDEQIERFGKAGMNFEWRLHTHDHPADMLERLGHKGFKIGEAECMLVFDLEQSPKRILESKHAPGSDRGDLKIERVYDTEGVRKVQALEETVWDLQMGWLFDDLEMMLHETPDFISIYLAYLDDIPVSAAWTLFAPGSHFADLYGGATLEAQRGKGLYTTLLATRAQEAIERGRRYLTVDAGEMSQPILFKRGFQKLVSFHSCEWIYNQ